MRKIAPLLTIISGLATIIFSIISLLAAHDIIGGNEWVGKFKFSSNATTLTYIIAIIVGFVQLMLGRASWKKPKGFASGILMVAFAVGIGVLIYASTTADKWPISTIITLSINGVAFIGITIGFFKAA